MFQPKARDRTKARFEIEERYKEPGGCICCTRNQVGAYVWGGGGRGGYGAIVCVCLCMCMTVYVHRRGVRGARKGRGG